MEYIYASMILHTAGQPITKPNVERILRAAGITATEAQLDTLLDALTGVDIADVLKVLPATPVPAQAAVPAQPAVAEAPKAPEPETSVGLDKLFGG